jgi:hypothetical protein
MLALLQPKFSKNGMSLFVEFPVTSEGEERQHTAVGKEPLKAENVFDVLRHIPPEALKYLGFNAHLIRPEWLLVTVRPGCVLSPCCCNVSHMLCKCLHCAVLARAAASCSAVCGL